MEEEITVKVEDAGEKLEHTLRPITYTSWLLGVGIARPKNCPKSITIIIRAIHFGVCSVLVAFSVMDFANFGKEFVSKIFEIMYYMNESICHVSSYYYLFHIARHYDRWPELMEKIESLDRGIGNEQSISGRGVRIRQALVISTVCFFGPLSLIAHVLYYYFTAPDQIFASDLLFYYTISQTLANSFVFNIIVYVICKRFEAINCMIRRLNERPEAYCAAFKIRRIRRLHNEARHVITTVNEIYGVDLLLCSTNSFIMVVAKLFRIYMSAAERKSGFIFLNNVIWMIYGGQFIAMCWECTLTHREINKIGPHLCELVLNVQNTTKSNKAACFRSFRCKDISTIDIYANNSALALSNFGIDNIFRTNFDRDCIRNEVNDFSLQLQQSHVAFSACDFFEMDNSLLTRFVSVITTYLIILVQFYKPEYI